MKQKITKYTNHLYWNGELLTKIKDEIDKLIKTHGKETRLEISLDKYDGINVYAYYKVEETDEEYQKRILNENILKENRRCLYEKLKKEFENELSNNNG